MVSTLKADLKAKLVTGSRTIRKTFPKRDQFAPELIYFSNCILNNRDPEPSGLEGLADVRVIRAILQSAEDNRPASVEQTEVKRRPSLQQEIARPAVTKPPRLVKAEPPLPEQGELLLLRSGWR